MSDFFSQPEEPKVDPEVKTDQPTETPSIIKLGEAEYSQAELEHLVGLGKIADEADRTYKTRVDKIWPEYTKSRQEIADLKAKLEAKEQEMLKQKVDTKQELSPEELKQLARKQGEELGIMFKEDFDQQYLQRRSAEKLIEDTQAVISDAKEKGLPETDVSKLLQHMQETGIKNPTKAYNDMFESEVDKWKQEQMNKVKPGGLFSLQKSTAGSKEPEPINFVGMKQDKLAQLVSEAMRGNQ